MQKITATTVLEQKEMKAAAHEGIRDVEAGRYQSFTRDLVDQIKSEVLKKIKAEVILSQSCSQQKTHIC